MEQGQNMKINWTKLWFFCLRSMVYCKRGLIWSGQIVFTAVTAIFNLLRQSIGLYLFRAKLSIQKNPQHSATKDRLLHLLGSREVLQIILFVAIFFFSFPQSQWFKQDLTQIPGHNTLLYQLLGPGEENFSLEEVSAETAPVISPQTESWKQGALVAQPLPQVSKPAGGAPEITGLSSGGTALAKPIIIPGASLPTASGKLVRSDIILHEVKSGETIGEIAEKYGLDLSTVLWANDLTARSYIRPGDQLKILPASGLIHKVKKGDTILKIAKLYNTAPEKIIKFNKLKEDGTDMVVGEHLLIPDGKKPVPVYVAPTRRYTQLSNIAAPPPSVATPAGSGYLWPAGTRHITQYYGWRHTGVDICGPTGTGLYASGAGTVIRSRCGWNGGYGCYIIIDHGGGITTLYGHASQLYVSVGDYVSQGQTIAAMGSTGRSTGPHLHFEVRVNGARQNPLRYIR
jgi:LysM repeat protein